MEHRGSRFGIYEELEGVTNNGATVYKQKGGPFYIFRQPFGTWTVGETLGGNVVTLQTPDLFARGNSWKFYNADEENWEPDPTIIFEPFKTPSCILQTSINISSSGPAAFEVPNYLGMFHHYKNRYSAGRPIWRNKYGKFLMIKQDKFQFGVYYSLTTDLGTIASGSAPTCPTEEKARYGKDGWKGWKYWNGEKFVEDETIKVVEV